MNSKIKIIRNEPLRQYTGDIVPEIAKANLTKLPPLIKARLEIEKESMVCATGRRSSTIKWNANHRKIIGLMLLESDSPVSASLRAFAAGVAGPLNITTSMPELSKICRDEKEDLQTRINAALSLIKFAEKGKTKAVAGIFEIRALQVRYVALKQAVHSKNKTIAALGKKYLLKETNKDIRELLNNKYETTAMKYSTSESK